MGKETATSRQDRGARGVGWPPQLVELFRVQRTSFVRLAYLLTGRRGVAEEIVQEAFIGALRSWSGIADPHRYVRAAVVNRCRSWGRHQLVVRAHPVEPPEPNVQQPDELWDALARLNARRRAAIVLRFYLDLPHAEIAEILGCGPATVRTSIHRGLRQLRREIER